MGLNWDATYAVALALHHAHPEADLGAVTLNNVFEWTIALPDFTDETSMCNDEILKSIFQEWYEVTIND